MFTYSTQKEEKEIVVCASENEGCCSEDEAGDLCCEKESCCANVPVSSHLNFSVIIGIDKKNEAVLSTTSLTTFDLTQLNSASELADGFLNSLIKPPAVA